MVECGNEADAPDADPPPFRPFGRNGHLHFGVGAQRELEAEALVEGSVD
jgi:hypothetical protein